MEQLIERTKQIDLIEMLGAYSELRRKSSGEYEGPCPFCGGDDRLSVRADGWFCRVCKPIDQAHGWHSAIDFVMARNNVDFPAAVELLTGDKLEVPVKPISAARRAESFGGGSFDQDWYERRVEAAELALEGSTLAMDYLANRGLTEATWKAYRVGYDEAVSLPATAGREKRPALVIPWVRGGKLIAVRFRFLEAHTYRNTDGKELTAKQTSRGNFRGALFGGQTMPEFTAMPVDDAQGRCAEQLRTLVLCEGEINAMSIWQVAQPWRWDVLSLGSESAKLSAGAVALAKRYGRVIVWMDRAKIASAISDELGAFKVYSPVAKTTGKSLDANDILQAGALDELLRSWRIKACRSDIETERCICDFEGDLPNWQINA